MRATITALLVGLSAIAPTGCGEQSGQKTAVDIKDVPPEIMKVATEKLPGVTFDTAWRKANGNFEVRGKAKNGKVREIDIRPDGSVEEIE